MNIRRAEIKDFENITIFYQYAIQHSPGMSEKTRWVYGLHPTDAMIRDYLSQEALYLLEDGDTILGAMAVTMSQGEDYHAIHWSVDAADDEVAVVHILCIHPDFQKQGLAKKMVLESIRMAADAQKKAVRLDALESNTPAQGMYLALGFSHRGKQLLYAKNTGWANFLYYEYPLDNEQT